jgi:hypothetical protein
VRWPFLGKKINNFKGEAHGAFGARTVRIWVSG